MGKIQTRFFGEIEIDKKKVIHFDLGLPAFEHLKDYIFMLDSDDESPFCWLQSIEDTSIAFTLVNIYSIKEDYNPSLEIEQLKSLGDGEDSDFFIYCIANIPKDIKKMSINLKAPIVINTNTNKARQILCQNDDYEIKHYIYKEEKAGDDIC